MTDDQNVQPLQPQGDPGPDESGFLVVRLKTPAPAGASLLAGRPAALAIGVCGFAFTVFAMYVAMIPPEPDQAAIFLVKVVGGAAFCVALGGLIYWRGRR